MAKTQGIDHVLARAAKAQDVPGVAAAASFEGKVIYEGAFGRRELGKSAPMTIDTVGWIASMTKAITGAAAMREVERGTLSLDAPAADVLPELNRTQVLEGFDAAGRPQLRAPLRPITLRHLLTHTSGFTYDMWSADMCKYQAATDTPGIISCQNKALTTPLLFDPGERWEYGIGIDWAGKMIEAVSGQRLGAYMEQHIFAPLGMTSTSFKLTPSQRTRLATIHARGADDQFAPMAFEVPQDPEFEMGGGGLYGTVQDYMKFTLMILNRGSYNGTQVLKPETVQSMAINQIGNANVADMKTAIPPISNDVNLTAHGAAKWGLTFMISAQATPQGRAPDSLNWAGLANSYFWIDPKRGVTGVFMTQILPFFDAKVIAVLGEFESAVYGSL